MKKNIIYFSTLSFIAGVGLHQIDNKWFIFTLILSTIIWFNFRNSLKQNSKKTLQTINPRTQFWDNIYFYLLSLNYKSHQIELRIWLLNVEDAQDFKSIVNLSEQIAIKSNLKLKLLATHTDLPALEKLIATDVSHKVRFSQLDASTVKWPFKNKFDIICVGKISKLLAANPNFHRRIENCIHNNSVLILDSENETAFMKNSWDKLAPGIFHREKTKESRNSTHFNLRNDLGSNFI